MSGLSAYGPDDYGVPRPVEPPKAEDLVGHPDWDDCGWITSDRFAKVYAVLNAGQATWPEYRAEAKHLMVQWSSGRREVRQEGSS